MLNVHDHYESWKLIYSYSNVLRFTWLECSVYIFISQSLFRSEEGWSFTVLSNTMWACYTLHILAMSTTISAEGMVGRKEQLPVSLQDMKESEKLRDNSCMQKFSALELS